MKKYLKLFVESLAHTFKCSQYHKHLFRYKTTVSQNSQRNYSKSQQGLKNNSI